MPKGIELHRDAQRRAAEQRRVIVAGYILSGIRSQKEMIRRLDEEHEIEVSAATMSRDVKALEEVYRETAHEAIQKERGITLMRLESYVERVVKRLHSIDLLREQSARTEYDDEKIDPMVLADDEKATIRLAKELEESRRKMLGLDMPSKVAHTDPTGTKEYTGVPEAFKDRFFDSDATHEVLEEIEEAEVLEEDED